MKMVNLKKKVNLNKRKTSRKVNLSKVYIPAERFIKRKETTTVCA